MMPRISDVLKEPKKPFKKKELRPWNFIEKMNEDSTDVDAVLHPEKSKAVVNSDVVKPEPLPVSIDSSSTNDAQHTSIEKRETNTDAAKSDHQVFDQGMFDEITSNSFFHLTGYQKALFFFIFERYVARDKQNSGPITLETMMEVVQSSKYTAKLALTRLEEKKIIKRLPGKRGRSGFCVFAIPPDVMQLAFEYMSKQGKSGNVVHQPFNAPVHQEKIESKSDLSKEWLSIDFSPLGNIGFTEQQIRQLAQRGTIQPDIVQESIYHFAFGLENNSDTQRYENPKKVFMGTLLKGIPWVEDNYRSVQEIAMERLIEERTKSNERKKKLEKQAYELALSEWLDSIRSSEKEKIAPAERKQGEAPQSVRLNLHFKEHVWPTVMKDYII